MQEFTRLRDDATPDEIWLLQHEPVFTLGRNAQREHLLNPGAIPVLAVDRGGQVTYHGPGQLVIYVLVDIRRKGLGVRELVLKLEQSVIDYLAQHHIVAQGDRAAPGVYVAGQKIAALGLRVSRGKTYHGLSFNIDPDLSAFQRINPCGYAGLAVTSCRQLGVTAELAVVAGEMSAHLARNLGYSLIAWGEARGNTPFSP